jgi:hypothetical protein
LGDLTIFENASARQWRAYFFDHNRFFPHRDTIDGAVISQIWPESVSAQLILNPLSARYTQFRQSEIVKRFALGLLDPNTEENAGNAVIVGADADRASEQTKLQYLGRKYGIAAPYIIRMGHFAALAWPPPDAKEPPEEC